MLIDDIRRANLSYLSDKAGGRDALAEAIGKDPSQVSQWINASINSGTGKPRGMRSSTCREIEKKLGLEIGWLELAHPELWATYENPYAHLANQPAYLDRFDRAKRTIKLTNTVTFDVLDVTAHCGDGALNSDHPGVVSCIQMPLAEAQRLVGTSNKNGQVQIITASKDSMAPTIDPDDLLFVDTSVQEYAGEAIYVLLHGGELLCKRLSLVGRDLMVISDNTAYPSWEWKDKPESTMIVGRVIRALPMRLKNFGQG